jgi:hypothetical protein
MRNNGNKHRNRVRKNRSKYKNWSCGEQTDYVNNVVFCGSPRSEAAAIAHERSMSEFISMKAIPADYSERFRKDVYELRELPEQDYRRKSFKPGAKWSSNVFVLSFMPDKQMVPASVKVRKSGKRRMICLVGLQAVHEPGSSEIQYATTFVKEWNSAGKRVPTFSKRVNPFENPMLARTAMSGWHAMADAAKNQGNIPIQGRPDLFFPTYRAGCYKNGGRQFVFEDTPYLRKLGMAVLAPSNGNDVLLPTYLIAPAEKSTITSIKKTSAYLMVKFDAEDEPRYLPPCAVLRDDVTVGMKFHKGECQVFADFAPRRKYGSFESAQKSLGEDIMLRLLEDIWAACETTHAGLRFMPFQLVNSQMDKAEMIVEDVDDMMGTWVRNRIATVLPRFSLKEQERKGKRRKGFCQAELREAHALMCSPDADPKFMQAAREAFSRDSAKLTDQDIIDSILRPNEQVWASRAPKPVAWWAGGQVAPESLDFLREDSVRLTMDIKKLSSLNREVNRGGRSRKSKPKVPAKSGS